MAGSPGERRVAELVAGRLRALGYDVEIQPVPLPRGGASRNLVARTRGPLRVVVVAHLDGVSAGPAANDNGSGVAVLLELARSLRGEDGVLLAAVGAEERVETGSRLHLGSHFLLGELTPEERGTIRLAISLDMVGYGSTLNVRGLEPEPNRSARLLLRHGGTYVQDTGQSDHAELTRAGIPAAWIEWRPDPCWHEACDTADRVKSWKLGAAARLVLAAIRDTLRVPEERLRWSASGSRRSLGEPPTTLAPVAPTKTLVGSILPADPRAQAWRPIAVDFPTRLRGYLALESGRLLRSSDGGRTWSVVSDGRRFDALEFVSPRIGYALSARVILRTLDGGLTWRRLVSFPKAPPDYGPGRSVISFVDADHAWVVPPEGRLYRTTDGGRTWTRLRVACPWPSLAGVSFVSRRLGFAVCGGQPATVFQYRRYLRTTDGGRTWTTTREAIFAGHVSGIEYVSPRVGFLSATRLGISRLADSKVILNRGDSESVLDMSWLDARHGFVLLFHSGLVGTDDVGRRWRLLYPPLARPPVGPVSFSSAREGIGGGLEAGMFSRRGAILATSDGGATWRLRGSLGDVWVDALARVSSVVVWALGSNRAGLGLFRSRDGGPALGAHSPLSVGRPAVALVSDASGRLRR